jgi:hypothetical protein
MTTIELAIGNQVERIDKTLKAWYAAGASVGQFIAFPIVYDGTAMEIMSRLRSKGYYAELQNNLIYASIPDLGFLSAV